MIGGLVAIGYKDLYDDYEQINPKDLLWGISTTAALDMVVGYQNHTVFSFGDVATHVKDAIAMRAYLEPSAQIRLDDFIGRHQNVSLFSTAGCLLFYKLALECYNSEDKPLTADSVRQVFKAYLYCNQYWTDKAAENIDPKDIVGLYIRVDLPIVEFKLPKDFKVQMFKAKEFFKYCEQDELFKPFLEWFCNDYKVRNWKDYLLRWFNFLSASLTNRWIKLDEEKDAEFIAFFDQYAICPSACSQIWTLDDQFYLRDHFLFSPKRGLYLLLHHSLMVDKFYQGMKFDIAETVLRHRGVNENGKLIKDKPEFNSLIGSKISEFKIFYSLMHKAFDGHFDSIYEGETLKPVFGNEAEPDFSMRKGNHLFLFEYKDLTLGDNIKYSNDIEFIRKEITRRICKGGSNNRKGGGQLLFSIDSIVNGKKMNSIDAEAEKADVIFPIIVTTDRSFSAMGVNYMIIPEFASLAHEFNLGTTHVSPAIVLDYDMLFMLCNQFHEGKLNLEKVLVSYTSLADSPGGLDLISSFHTFAYDNYRPEKESEEQLQYVLGDLINELGNDL